MQLYDSTFILNPQAEESNFDAQIKEAVELIARYGGKLVHENRFGMRRLAYEIQHLTQGYYVSLVYEGTGDVVKELERHFRLSEHVVRFLTTIYQQPEGAVDEILAAVPEQGIAAANLDEGGENEA
jgi:small subunit ribosomal protein S6